MNKPLKKPIIGILGGICSGKSSVAAEFCKFGCGIVDADEIAHGLLNEETVKGKIISIFSNDILDEQGKIDRKKLAKEAFIDTQKISELNSIVHGQVLSKAEELINQYNSNPKVKAIVLDMPLLMEVGWDKKCDKLIFVDCKRQLRAERAQKYCDFDENELKIRENFQISLDKKKKISDNVVNSNSDFLDLSRQVAEIFSDIVSNG